MRIPPYCESCGSALAPRDLFPVFSYLLSRGKCRHCSARINPVYPLCEIALIAVSLLAYGIFGFEERYLLITFLGFCLTVWAGMASNPWPKERAFPPDGFFWALAMGGVVWKMQGGESLYALTLYGFLGGLAGLAFASQRQEISKSALILAGMATGIWMEQPIFFLVLVGAIAAVGRMLRIPAPFLGLGLCLALFIQALVPFSYGNFHFYGLSHRHVSFR